MLSMEVKNKKLQQELEAANLQAAHRTEDLLIIIDSQQHEISLLKKTVSLSEFWHQVITLLTSLSFLARLII